MLPTKACSKQALACAFMWDDWKALQVDKRFWSLSHALKSSVWTRPVPGLQLAAAGRLLCSISQSAVSLYALENKHTRCFRVLCTVRTTLVAWIMIHTPLLNFNWKYSPHYQFLHPANHLPQPRNLMDDTSVSIRTCSFLPHHTIKSWYC